MCAYVKRLDPDNPEEICVSVSIPRSTAELSSIREALPELRHVLAERWPVERIDLALRNPVNLTQWEITLLISLAAPILKPLGEKLRDEAFKWIRKRFRVPSKKKRKTPRP
jgi:hypothetical protein